MRQPPEPEPELELPPHWRFLDKIEHWVELAARRRTKASWIKQLSLTAVSPYAAQRWWVTHNPVPVGQIVEVLGKCPREIVLSFR